MNQSCFSFTDVLIPYPASMPGWNWSVNKPENFPNGIAASVLNAARLTYLFCEDAERVISKAIAMIKLCFILIMCIGDFVMLSVCRRFIGYFFEGQNGDK